MKIKIPYTVPATQRTGRNEVELELDPKVILEALEEQAPEVLRKWGMKQAGYAMRGDLRRHINQTARIAEGIVLDFNDPWIKVSDQEPPKDGKEFITIDEHEQPNIHDFIGGEWRNLEDERYPENEPPFVIWMPKPV